jgi:hypothetical protein
MPCKDCSVQTNHNRLSDDRAAADVLGALDVWRKSLVNISGANRLINFKESRTGSVPVDDPSAYEIVDGLRSRRLWSIEGVREDESAPDAVKEDRRERASQSVLWTPRLEKDLGPILRGLLRRSRQEFLDRGLSVLYLAVGLLDWREEDDATNSSPLLLMPVELESTGPRDKPRLRSGEDDPVLNPALTRRCEDLGVTLPTVDELADLDIKALFSAVRRAIGDRSGWTLRNSVVLSCFSFHKEAMYRDLQDNESRVIAHPLVKAIAGQDARTQTARFWFDEITAKDIDRVAPPEKSPLVLDADSSQRACIAAAVEGRSFVMDGPPGTGKSQTITNMIGALLHAGKTVLFVSEKAAALDVVRNRLAEAGLDSYLLELHSHKASRKQVAGALLDALDTTPVPPAGMQPVDRRTVAKQREQLNAYADAMNKIREPLGYSLHHVLGMLAELGDIPVAPAPDPPPHDLTPETFESIRDASARISRAWRPASQGATYLWREVCDRTSLETRLYAARTALEEVKGIVRSNRRLTEAFALDRPSDVPVILSLLAQMTSRPPGVQDQWLTVPDLTGVFDVAHALSADLTAMRKCDEVAQAHCGVSWRSLPDPTAIPGSPRLDASALASLDLSQLNERDARTLADRFEANVRRLDARSRSLQALTELLRLPPVRTLDNATAVLELVALAYAENRPEPAWLSPEGHREAARAAALLRERVTAQDQAESAARPYFAESVAEARFDDLHERFTELHRGLRKVLPAYRRDKRTVAGFAAEDVAVDAAIQNLDLAVAWQHAREDLDDAVAEHAAALGSYWRGRSTDFAAVDEAVGHAEHALRLASADSMPAVVKHVCADDPPTHLRDLVTEIRADLDHWRANLTDPPIPATRPDLLLEPLTDMTAWLQEHAAALHDATARIAAVNDVVGRDLTLAEADVTLSYRQAADDAEHTLRSRVENYRIALGPLVNQGIDADETALATALEWSRTTRVVRSGNDQPLIESQSKALSDALPTPKLVDAYRRWEEARDNVVAAFSSSRHAELTAELDDFALGVEFLSALNDDSGQQEWFSYQEARADLAKHHLDAAVDFCIHQAVAAADVPKVIDRALLRAWADQIIGTDSALQPVRAQDRDALVAEYRTLDRQLIPAATSEIINAVNARRPKPIGLGEPGTIRREGMKKSRHIPVRELIARTRNTTLALKPCFMMSPLAVSQYLPSDMTFDVVIFDEASQVTPGDAVNCIYRAEALIAAGDDRQLPPTSFFDRVTDDTGEDAATDVTDFQSVLELAKACGAFKSLSLRWHYRSRHEALIAFSNLRFYEGKLITYPGAHIEGPDIGVEMFHVPGKYRRGTSRDNPIEAEHVVERILHHYTVRPESTLGVVTFSVAQADAIETALEHARLDRPDLTRYFDGDRLHGFFVKSLESVQGDERDVMIFSIGYGPDDHGKITVNFGALNKPKGWRRLNVAITRARERVEIVTSIRARDVPETSNESVQHFVRYLDYAERGIDTLAVDPLPTRRDAESPFEESVLDFLRSQGCSAEPQVGAAGYRIDIGIPHPDQRNVYVLGVECDGAMYHSSPAARDRDRLREQVLRGLGWRLHRIWGTAWYRNRQHEQERLLAAIAEAIEVHDRGQLPVPESAIERPVIATVDVEQVAEYEWTSPYRKATITPLPSWLDKADPATRFEMVHGVEEVTRVEGPVHIDVMLKRLRDAWNIGRVGKHIRVNVDAAIRNSQVVRDGDLLDLPNRPVTTVRLPAEGVNRSVEQVSDQELELAIANLVSGGGAVNQDELMTATARVFEWGRRGPEITSRLTSVIRRMVTSGKLAGTDTALTPGGEP